MKKEIRNWLYLLSFTPAAICIYGNTHGTWFVFGNILYSLFFLGGIEWISKPIISNLHSPNKAIIPKIILHLHIPAQIMSVFSLYFGISSGIIGNHFIIAAAISTGLNSGSSAIVAAHELIHKKDWLERFAGKLLLFTSGNFYFYIDHLFIHHKWVGTSRDHASAKKGEGLYHFFFRSVKGQINGAFKLEMDRLQKKGKSKWNLNNYVLNQIVFQLIFALVLLILFGIPVFVAWLIQCLIANFLLEYVNYIEHYGLSRAENTRVNEKHSWDSDQWISRFVLVDLSRHADHHYYASKPFHTLMHYEGSPKLPSGYAGMFLIAAIPPLWFKLMNKRLDQINNVVING